MTNGPATPASTVPAPAPVPAPSTVTGPSPSPVPPSPVPPPAFLPASVVTKGNPTVGEWFMEKDFEKVPRWVWFAGGGGLLLLIIIIAIMASSGGSKSSSYRAYAPQQSQSF